MWKRPVFIVVTLAVLLVGAKMVSKSLHSSAGKDENQYRLAAVQTGQVKKTVTATGTLKPWTTVDIRSRAGGRVVSYGPDLQRKQDEPDKPLRELEEGSLVKKGQILVNIDPSDTLLTYNTARADIDSNQAHIDETKKTLSLQEQQTLIAIQNAQASLESSRATAASALARYQSAKSQAEAQKSLTPANIESAEATLASEQEKLNQINGATMRQQNAGAVALLRQAKANLNNAELQLKRQKALLAKGFVAASQVDQAQATYDVELANVLTAQERMDTIKPELDGDLKTQEARVRQAKAALDTAKASGVDIELKRQSAASALADYHQAQAAIAQAQAALKQTEANRINNSIRVTQIAQAQASKARSTASLVNAQVQLNETKVTAPSDGIMLKKYVEKGTLITSGLSFNSTGTNIVQLGDISRMYVDVQVDETDVASVDIDQKVDITFDAYPTTPIEGKVIKIEPEAVVDQNVTTVHVWVEVDNGVPAFKLLKPGMNASCEFIVDKKDDVAAIPNEALKQDTDGSRYVETASGGTVAPADKDNPADDSVKVGVKIEKRKVEVGLEGNETSEIKSGVKEGDTIITQTIEPSTSSPGGSPFGSSKGPAKK